MSDAQDGLIERLRAMAAQRDMHGVVSVFGSRLNEVADVLAAQAGEIAQLRAELAAAWDENARLTTLYAAATESLAAAWDEARKQ